MTLGKVLEGVRLRQGLPSGDALLAVAGLEYDSRRVEKEACVFRARRGTRVDGPRFARQAREQGAAAVVSEDPRPEDFDGVWIEVENGRQAAAIAARNFYGKPDERIHFTGITGTNGKTTTSNVLDAILREAGHVTGVLGTIEFRLAGRAQPANHTTPEAIDFTAVSRRNWSGWEGII